MSHTRDQHFEMKANKITFKFFDGCSICRMDKHREELKNSPRKELTPEDLKRIRESNILMKKMNKFWY